MVPLEEFKYGGTNVTAFRILDPEREEVGIIFEILTFHLFVNRTSYFFKAQIKKKNALYVFFLNMQHY